MNRFKVVIVMFLCAVVFSACPLSPTVAIEHQFTIFKYKDGVDYSENMPNYYPLFSNNSSSYGGWRYELRTIPLTNDYYAAVERDVDDVYLTSLTIAEYIELDSLHLLTQAFIDSLPKDSNVYCEFYGTKGDRFSIDCWGHYGRGLDTAKLNLIIRNGELDQYFHKIK